jgi:hypothetical protein
MAGLVPFDWTTAFDALYTWLHGQLDIPVWWENQDHPRGSYPYATLGVTAGPVQAGGTDLRRVSEDAPGTGVYEKAVTDHEMTISCQAFVSHDGDSEIDFDSNAVALLSIAHASLGLRDTISTLNSAGLSVRDAMPVRSLPPLAEGSFVDRAIFDMRCGLAFVVDPAEYVTSIGTLYVSSDMSGQSGTGDLDIDDEPFGG